MRYVLIVFLLFNVVSFSQSNANLFNLASSYEQAGELNKATELYLRLHKLEPKNENYIVALLRVYQLTKKFDEAITLLDNLIAQNNSFQHYADLGKFYYLKGDEKKAYETWDKGLTVNNEDFAYRYFSDAALERRAFDKAIEYLQKGKEKSQDKMGFSYQLANLYNLTMRYADAAKEYCFMIQSNPGLVNQVLNAVMQTIAKPDALNQMLPVIEDCADKNNPQFLQLLSKMYLENKQYEQAFEYYQKLDEVQNSGGVELYNLARSVQSSGNFDLAIDIYNRIIDEEDNNVVVERAKMGIALTLEEKLQLNRTSWRPFGSPEINKKDLNDLLKLYSGLTSAYKNSDVENEANLRIAKLKMAYSDNLDEAEQNLLKIPAKSPFYPFAQFELGELYLIKGDLYKSEEAYNTANEFATRNPELRYLSMFKISRLYFFKGDFPKAKLILEPLLTNMLDNSSNDALELSLLLNTQINDSSMLVKFASAELLIEQKKYQEALELLSSLQDVQKNILIGSISSLRMAEINVTLNNLELSISLINKIIEENSKNIFADKSMVLLGQIYLHGYNDINKALEIYNNFLVKYPNSIYLDNVREEIFNLRKRLESIKENG